MFSHILVPVDGSKNAQAALDRAVELAGLTGAELSVLTIYRHHSMLEASFSMVRAADPGPIDDTQREYASEVAETAKRRAREAGAAKVRAFVRNGPVARGIVAFAREHGCDLIVMGGRGMGSIEGYLLGSVSHKVTGMADCPVMVV
jgi:nucleotide-binding universal stress UspA family protein